MEGKDKPSTSKGKPAEVEIMDQDPHDIPLPPPTETTKAPPPPPADDLPHDKLKRIPKYKGFCGTYADDVAANKVTSVPTTVEGTGPKVEYKHTDIKERCLLYMIIGVCQIMKFDFGARFHDFRAGIAAANVFRTCHTFLRQQVNGLSNGNASQGVTEDVETYISGQKITLDVKRISGELKDLAGFLGLKYTKASGSDTEHWYGTMAPLMMFATTFKNRLEELRLGTSKFLTQKTKVANKQATAASFGFQHRHAPLLNGVTYPPSSKSSMIRSLGFGTQLVSYFMNQTSAYDTKFIMALNETAKFLGADPKFWNLLKMNKGATETQNIVSQLCDIMLMLTPRNTRKATVPPHMMINLLSSGLRRHFLEGKTKPNVEYPNQVTGGLAGYMDFSSTGLWAWANLTQNDRIDFPYTGGDVDTYVKMAQQVLIHCIYGTQFEDLSLMNALWQGTFDKWYNRKDLATFFLGMFSCSTNVSITLPAPKHASKLSSACMTSIMPVPKSQLCQVPQFAGMRVSPILDNFIQTLRGETYLIGAPKTLADAKQAVYKFFHAIFSLYETKSIINMGTMEWLDVMKLELGPEMHEVRTVNSVVPVQNHFFNSLDMSGLEIYKPNEEKTKAAVKRRLETIKKMEEK